MTKPTSTKGRACAGKRRHPTQHGARQAIARWVRHGAHPDRLEAYHCAHCDGWHIGHTARGRR